MTLICDRVIRVQSYILVLRRFCLSIIFTVQALLVFSQVLKRKDLCPSKYIDSPSQRVLVVSFTNNPASFSNTSRHYESFYDPGSLDLVCWLRYLKPLTQFSHP